MADKQVGVIENRLRNKAGAQLEKRIYKTLVDIRAELELFPRDVIVDLTGVDAPYTAAILLGLVETAVVEALRGGEEDGALRSFVAKVDKLPDPTTVTAVPVLTDPVKI